MQRPPRLPFFRLLLPRLSPAKPILPTTARSHHSRKPSIRIATASSSRGFRAYAPLRQDSPSSSSPSSSPTLENEGITQKLKVLIKSYGWYALGVYLALSVVDFSIAFAAINLLGADQVGKATNYIKHAVLDVFHPPSTDESPDAATQKDPTSGAGNESLYAMIVLAYTVHKTLFMPVRAGLTVALTPRLVRWLRARGWTGAAGTRRAGEHLRDKLKRNRD